MCIVHFYINISFHVSNNVTQPSCKNLLHLDSLFSVVRVIQEIFFVTLIFSYFEFYLSTNERLVLCVMNRQSAFLRREEHSFEHCSDDTSLTAVLLIFSNCFWSSNTSTDTAKHVIFLFADVRQKCFSYTVFIFYLPT